MPELESHLWPEPPQPAMAAVVVVVVVAAVVVVVAVAAVAVAVAVAVRALVQAWPCTTQPHSLVCHRRRRTSGRVG